MTKLSLTSCSPDETRALGERLGARCGPGDWIGLSGELGAGKTCLVQGLARGLEVDPQLAVTSPTFVILQTYPGRVPLHHLDLYRLSRPAELDEIGYHQLVEGDGTCVVEWAEQVDGAVPGRGLLIRLLLVDETTRRLEAEALDPAAERLLEALRCQGPRRGCTSSRPARGLSNSKPNSAGFSPITAAEKIKKT